MFDLSCDKNRFPTTARNQNGEDVTFSLFYRRPTNEEIVAYNKALFVKRNGKVVNSVVPTRIEFGLKILTGVQDGVFSLSGKPVSSDPSSPDYHPDWKGMLKNALAANVINFAFRVFESVSDAQVDPEDLLVGEEGEEVPPLARS
jgi:hypothetical protein